MRTPTCKNGYKKVKLDIFVTPTPLQLTPIHDCGGVLRGDERIALVPHLQALADFFADLGQFGQPSPRWAISNRWPSCARKSLPCSGRDRCPNGSGARRRERGRSSARPCSLGDGNRLGLYAWARLPLRSWRFPPGERRGGPILSSCPLVTMRPERALQQYLPPDNPARMRS